jgi:hypothetical protein
MISLSRNGLLVLEYSFGGNSDGVYVQELPGVNNEFAEGALDGELLKSVTQLVPVVQQDPVQVGHLLRRVARRLLQVVRHLEQVLLAVNQVVGPSHVHQLVIQKHLYMAQRFFHLQKKESFVFDPKMDNYVLFNSDLEEKVSLVLLQPPDVLDEVERCHDFLAHFGRRIWSQNLDIVSDSLVSVGITRGRFSWSE